MQNHTTAVTKLGLLELDTKKAAVAALLLLVQAKVFVQKHVFDPYWSHGLLP